MRLSILPLLLALGGNLTNETTGVRTPPACPAENTTGRQIATRYATAPQYASARTRAGVTAAEPAQVRLLTDGQDAATCRQLMEVIRHKAESTGGSLARVDPVFYEAAGFYYAVLTQRPHHTPTRGGTLYVDGRWTPLYVVSPSFEIRASAAM